MLLVTIFLCTTVLIMAAYPGPWFDYCLSAAIAICVVSSFLIMILPKKRLWRILDRPYQKKSSNTTTITTIIIAFSTILLLSQQVPIKAGLAFSANELQQMTKQSLVTPTTRAGIYNVEKYYKSGVAICRHRSASEEERQQNIQNSIYKGLFIQTAHSQNEDDPMARTEIFGFAYKPDIQQKQVNAVFSTMSYQPIFQDWYLFEGLICE
jgi:hypothetical protein